MINVTLDGNIASDPREFTYGDNKLGVSFTVVSNEGFGENQVATFIRCTRFGASKEFINLIKKGNQVFVYGALTSNEVTRTDGTKYTAYEVRVNNIAFGRQSRKNAEEYNQSRENSYVGFEE